MPDQVLPQIELTGSGAGLDPAQVLGHALTQYQATVRADAEARVLAGPADLTGDILGQTLMEVASGHLNVFRITAGVAFRRAIKESHARQLQQVTEVEAAQAADDAAMNLGAYLAATSSNAVMDGYHLNINAKIPPKEAARRATHAFGLTSPQMRTAFQIKDDGVVSAKPGAWKNLLDRFIDRAFGQRVTVLVGNSLRQVESDAVQRGWERDLADGSLPMHAQKMWLTATDERTCPVCAPMDLVTVGVMDSFRLPDGNRVKTPPVHPNCRCQAELVDEPTEVAKAFNPEERRDPAGRWAKTKERDPEALANVTRLVSNVGLDSPARLQSNTLRPSQTLGSAPTLGAAQRLASAQTLRSAQALSSADALRTTGPLEALPSTMVLDGKRVLVSRLSLTYRSKLATSPDYVDQVRDEPVDLPPAHLLTQIPSRHVAFAPMRDLDLDDLGGADIEDLTFVDLDDPDAVRGAVNQAMGPLDAHLQDYGSYEEMDDAEASEDSGVRGVAKRLRVQAMSTNGRPPRDPILRVAPDDAKEAWRIILAPPEDGMAPTFPVYLDEGRDGEPLTETTTDAATIVALSGVPMDSPLAPQVLTAPHGTWDDQDIGITVRMHSGPTADLKVTGPYRWKRGRGGIQLTPDVGAYRRANPEY